MYVMMISANIKLCVDVLRNVLIIDHRVYLLIDFSQLWFVP